MPFFSQSWWNNKKKKKKTGPKRWIMAAVFFFSPFYWSTLSAIGMKIWEYETVKLYAYGSSRTIDINSIRRRLSCILQRLWQLFSAELSPVLNAWIGFMFYFNIIGFDCYSSLLRCRFQLFGFQVKISTWKCDGCCIIIHLAAKRIGD